MKTRPRLLAGLMVLLVTTGVIYAQEHTLEDLTERLNFTLNLKDFSRTAETGDTSLIESGKFVVLEGAVGLTDVLENNEDSFLARVELLNGEWLDPSRVELYRAYILLNGQQWQAYVPARRSRNPGPLELTANKRLMVLAKPIGFMEDAEGTMVAVLQGFEIKFIQ